MLNLIWLQKPQMIGDSSVVPCTFPVLEMGWIWRYGDVITYQIPCLCSDVFLTFWYQLLLTYVHRTVFALPPLLL